MQLELGGRGQVHPYVQRTNRAHPYIGWYATMTFHLAACECRYCIGARTGRPVYLGAHERDAIKRIGSYQTRHGSHARV